MLEKFTWHLSERFNLIRDFDDGNGVDIDKNLWQSDETCTHIAMTQRRLQEVIPGLVVNI